MRRAADRHRVLLDRGPVSGKGRRARPVVHRGERWLQPISPTPEERLAKRLHAFYAVVRCSAAPSLLLGADQ